VIAAADVVVRMEVAAPPVREAEQLRALPTQDLLVPLRWAP